MFILKRRRRSNLKAGRCTLTQLNCWAGLRLAQHSDWDDDLMVNKYHSVWRRSRLQKNAPPVWQVVLRKCSASIYRVEQRPDKKNKKNKKNHPHTWQNLNAKGSVRIFVWLRSEVARTPHPPSPVPPSLPPSVPLLTDPCLLWCTISQRVHQIPSVMAKQPHNEKCLNISLVSQTPFRTKALIRPEDYSSC